MRYAIAILPDSIITEWAVINRRGMAKNFPVHITLKGRFNVKPDTSVSEVVSDVASIFAVKTFPVDLNGPIYIDGRIRWVECLTGNQGYDTLKKMHQACVSKLLSASYVDSYRTPGPYELDDFRPHMTLDWDDHGIFIPEDGRIKEDLRIRANFESWVIMEYTEDYLRRGVRVVYSSPFFLE